MKTFFSSTLALIASFFIFSSFLTLPTHAQSETLSAPLENSGIRVVREGDTIYLSVEEEDVDEIRVTQTEDSDDEASPSGDQVDVAREEIEPPTGFATDIGNLINAVLSLVMVIAVLLVFFFLIWGAFDWITSGGDRGKTQQARQKIIAAVVGLLIIAASYAILTLVLRFLGYEGLNDALEGIRTIS